MNEQHRREALAVLKATDDELRNAIDTVHSKRSRELGILALRVSRSDRLKLAKKLERNKKSSKAQTFTCQECNKSKPLDEEADSGMCWECWLLLMT